MAGPTPFGANTYVGTLRLDDPNEEAWLGYTGGAGEPEAILMMLDPSPSGAYDPTEVVAAWRYFSNKPGVGNGSTIHVVGFIATPPGGTEELLHVVRA